MGGKRACCADTPQSCHTARGPVRFRRSRDSWVLGDLWPSHCPGHVCPQKAVHGGVELVCKHTYLILFSSCHQCETGGSFGVWLTEWCWAASVVCTSQQRVWLTNLALDRQETCGRRRPVISSEVQEHTFNYAAWHAQGTCG